jgi:hypothetical protein
VNVSVLGDDSLLLGCNSLPDRLDAVLFLRRHPLNISLAKIFEDQRSVVLT